MYRSIITTLCFALTVISTQAKSKEYKKEFEKTYAVNSDVTFELETSFGDVNIQTWEKNEIYIHASIVVDSKSEENAQDIFEHIEILMSGSSSLVKMETEIKKGICNGNFSIDIEVKMPISGWIKGSHEFGSLDINQLDGKMDLEISYGELNAEALNYTNNYLSVEFGDGTIKTFGGGEISVSFGSLELTSIEHNSTIECSYGDIVIETIQKNVKELDLSVEFGDLEITLEEAGNASIEAESSFGDIDFPRKMKLIEKESDPLSKSILAELGTGDGGNIQISCEFGSVEIDIVDAY